MHDLYAWQALCLILMVAIITANHYYEKRR